MDLILKVFIFVIIVVAVLSGVILMTQSGSSQHSQGINQSSAEQLVLSDLKATHPNASISVTSVSPSVLSTTTNQSWNIVVSLAYNSSRPCPTFLTEAFDYPATGLAPTTYDIYTNYSSHVCIVYGYTNSTTQSYPISVPEVAIARSYNTMAPYLVNFVNTFSYDRTVVAAKYYSSLAASATPLGRGISDAWLVNYSSQAANYNQYVLLNQSGRIIGNYTIMKTT